jgi:hypothetical protein
MKEFITTLKTSTISLLMLALMFLVVEPAIGNAIEDQFTVTQSVTAEISFLTPAADITMSPSLAGITGGTSNGSTYVRVLTNNALGYNMTLSASSSAGMLGNSQGGTIPALVPAVAGVPDYAFTTMAANTAGFAYTVEASTTGEITQPFRDNGSACNTGSGEVANTCWLNATTGPMMIVNRSSQTAASGATTTIKFRTIIMPSPSPAIPQDTYVATTTLTAVVNP